MSETKGPPAKIADHLIEVHTRNGTLDKVLDSGIGDTLEQQLLLEIAYLSGYTPTYGYELWSYEGGTTVSLIADIISGSGSSNPGAPYGGFIEFNGDLYFTADNGVHGYELHKLSTDGSISLVADINSGSGGSFAGGNGGFIEFNGDLYFKANDGVNGYELHKLSGTDGSVSVIDINSGSGSSNPGLLGGFIEFNGDLYFLAQNDVSGWELHKLSGTDSSVSVIDIYSGSGDSFAGRYGFIEFNGDLYFTAYDPVNGYELRKLSGTDSSVSVIDINSGSGHSFAGQYGGFIEFNGDLYFTAHDGVHGHELHKLSGTDSSVSVIDINSGSGHSVAGGFGGFIEFNGDLYFTANNGVNGYELHKLSGTDSSVSLVDDINSGSGHSVAGQYGGFVEFDGDLYFTAYDPDNGYELRKLDGSTGEIQTFDLVAGTDSSYAQVLGVVNGDLAIAAWFDRDGDGPAGLTRTMLASDGEPASTADFQIVDDGSGEFVPGNSFYVSDSFFIV